MLAPGGSVEMTIETKFKKARGSLFPLLAWGIILTTGTALSGQTQPSNSGSTNSNMPATQSAAPGMERQTMPPHNDNITRRDIVDMDHLLDSHPEAAEQLRKDPSLIDNRQWVSAHPELQDYLQKHPQIADAFRSNPNQFMHDEDRMDRNDISRRDVADMDRFLDSHPEIAEQLRKDPSLIDNNKWVAAHPALQDYLQKHPQIADVFRSNPNQFMRDEDRYEHQDADNHYGYNDRDRDHDRDIDRDRDRDRDMEGDRDHDRDRGELTSFGRFLGGHSSLAADLQRDPSLANNQEYRTSHPELDEYLKAHPAMNQQLATNPQGVMTSNWVQQNGVSTGSGVKTGTPETPKTKANPNQ
jgi:hypothetical protein